MTGLAHTTTFMMSVTINGKEQKDEGCSKRAAKEKCAEHLLSISGS
jgi:dsRNA-specific ribonuclease